jgi:hypothetical protein
LYESLDQNWHDHFLLCRLCEYFPVCPRAVDFLSRVCGGINFLRQLLGQARAQGALGILLDEIGGRLYLDHRIGRGHNRFCHILFVLRGLAGAALGQSRSRGCGKQQSHG